MAVFAGFFCCSEPWCCGGERFVWRGKRGSWRGKILLKGNEICLKERDMPWYALKSVSKTQDNKGHHTYRNGVTKMEKDSLLSYDRSEWSDLVLFVRGLSWRYAYNGNGFAWNVPISCQEDCAWKPTGNGSLPKLGMGGVPLIAPSCPPFSVAAIVVSLVFFDTENQDCHFMHCSCVVRTNRVVFGLECWK